MEDTATVEICRAQIWQWIHRSARLVEGPVINPELFGSILKEEMAKITAVIEPQPNVSSKGRIAGELLNTLATSDRFAEFMTLLAYDYLG
jgi:malate synthase